MKNNNDMGIIMPRPDTYINCLGVDPGIANCGLALVRQDRDCYELIESTLITTTPKHKTPERYLQIYKQVDAFIEVTKPPDIISIEKSFFNRNITSHTTTMGVAALIQLLAAQHKREVYMLSPTQVKAAAGLPFNARKDAVIACIGKVLKIKHIELNNHIADAAACAVGGLLYYQKNKVRGGKE